MAKFDPWAEQDAYDTAIDKGAIYTCPRTGWRVKCRHFQPWSPYPRKAAALVWSRPEEAAVAKKQASGAKLTPAEQELYDAATLETGIRSGIIGWSGVTDPSGKKLESSIENMMFVFGRLKRFWSDVNDFMVNPENFGLGAQRTDRVPVGVDAEGNSSGTSDSPEEDLAAS